MGHGGGGHIGGGHIGGGHIGGGGGVHIGGGGHGGGGHIGGQHNFGGPHPGFNGPHHHPGYSGYGGAPRGGWGWGFGGPTVVVAGGGYNTYPAGQVYMTDGSYPPQMVPAQPEDPVCCNCCCLPPIKCMQLCAVVFLIHGLYLIGIDVLDFITINITDTYIYMSVLESIYGLLEVIFCVVCLMALSKKAPQPNVLSTYYIWRFFSVIISFAFLSYFYANNYIWENTLTSVYFTLQVVTSIWKLPAAVIAMRARSFPVLIWPAPIQSAPTGPQGPQQIQQQGPQPIQQQVLQGPQPIQQQVPQGPQQELPPKYENRPPPPNPYLANSQTAQPRNVVSPTNYPTRPTQP